MRSSTLITLALLFTTTFLLLAGCVKEYSSVDGQELVSPPWEADTFPADSVRLLLRQKVESTLEAGGWSAEIADQLSSFYAHRDYRPGWLVDGEIKPHAEVLLRDLCSAEADGLHSSAYEPDLITAAIGEYFSQPTVDKLVKLDLVLTWSFMKYSSDLARGLVDPGSLRSEVYLTTTASAADSMQTAIMSTDPPDSFSTLFMPAHEHYKQLRSHLERYRTIQASGGWPQLGPGSLGLAQGARNKEVVSLKKRLAVSGDLAPTNVDSVSTYTVSVAEGVAAFQQRHGLVVDSTVNQDTFDALNVSVSERITQIESNLERWRWLPQDLGDRYIYVNIPAYLVHGFVDDNEELRMRVVVGSEYGNQQTPVFRDEMDRVIFRPYWNLPDGIAADEVIPNAEGDPEWLSRNHYEVVERASGTVVPVDEIDFSAVPSEKYQVRQTPGRHNALGLVKYIFPNRHDIYLHDTPSDHLFDRIERDFSHGCIRLENPDVFGHHILRDLGWTLDDVQDAIRGEERKVVYLEEKVPVYLMYNTAFVQDGRMNFREDIYGFDAALEEALAAARRAAAPDSEAHKACQNTRLLRHAI